MAAVARDPTGGWEEDAAVPVLRPVPEPETEAASDEAEAVSEAAAGGGAAAWWGWVGRLRPPDVWDTPAPTLREEWVRTVEGAHLPAAVWLRRAEVVRQAVSMALIAGLLLLVHVNRSAGRQAVALVVVAALVVAFRAAT